MPSNFLMSAIGLWLVGATLEKLYIRQGQLAVSLKI